MGNYSSLDYTLVDTYIIREYLGKPLGLTTLDNFYDYKYKKNEERRRLNDFFRLNVFWEKYFRERVGNELEHSWMIYALQIFKQRPVMKLINRRTFTDRSSRNVFRPVM